MMPVAHCPQSMPSTPRTKITSLPSWPLTTSGSTSGSGVGSGSVVELFAGAVFSLGVGSLLTLLVLSTGAVWQPANSTQAAAGIVRRRLQRVVSK